MHDIAKLDVYQRALELLAAVDAIYESMPPGRAHLRDQLDRAATSVVLNIAEGAGEFSAPEKQRFYRMARRSGTEVMAILEHPRPTWGGPGRCAWTSEGAAHARRLDVGSSDPLAISGTGTGTGTGTGHDDCGVGFAGGVAWSGSSQGCDMRC